MSFLLRITLLIALLDACFAKTFGKCELASLLANKFSFTRDEVKNWVCIAEFESTFNSSAINHSNWDGSEDYGLFQLNNRYWCGSNYGKNVCGMECEDLLDDDLTDDIACAKRIKRDTERWMKTKNGLIAWVAYVSKCQNRNLDEYISECDDYLISATTTTSETPETSTTQETPVTPETTATPETTTTSISTTKTTTTVSPIRGPQIPIRGPLVPVRPTIKDFYEALETIPDPSESDAPPKGSFETPSAIPDSTIPARVPQISFTNFGSPQQNFGNPFESFSTPVAQGVSPPLQPMTGLLKIKPVPSGPESMFLISMLPFTPYQIPNPNSAYSWNAVRVPPRLYGIAPLGNGRSIQEQILRSKYPYIPPFGLNPTYNPFSGPIPYSAARYLHATAPGFPQNPAVQSFGVHNQYQQAQQRGFPMPFHQAPSFPQNPAAHSFGVHTQYQQAQQRGFPMPFHQTPSFPQNPAAHSFGVHPQYQQAQQRGFPMTFHQAPSFPHNPAAQSFGVHDQYQQAQ